MPWVNDVDTSANNSTMIHSTFVYPEATEDSKAVKNPPKGTIKEKTNRSTSRKIIEDFINNSTLHGLQNVYNSRSKMQRIVWVVLMLTASVYVVSMITDSFITYAGYPVKTKTTLMFTENSVFPAVTICNFNRYRQSPLKGTSYEDIFDALGSSYFKGKEISWEKYNFSEIDLSRLDDDLAHELMIIDCRWQGQHCDYKNFSSLFTSMGKCHTFNSGNVLLFQASCFFRSFCVV